MKRLCLGCITCFILALTTACSSGSEYDLFATLHGTVTEASTGEPVSNASVMLQPGGTTQTTDSNGYFEFTGLDPQQYTITVQKSGYQTNRKSATAISGEKIEVNITISK